MTRTNTILRFGCEVDKDSDGDWVIIPPPDVTIFSEPGEGVLLLWANSYEEALREAGEYLASISKN